MISALAIGVFTMGVVHGYLAERRPLFDYFDRSNTFDAFASTRHRYGSPARELEIEMQLRHGRISLDL